MALNKVSGADIICNSCKLYKTKDCVKWHYWENVSPAYAKMCGECYCKVHLKPNLQRVIK